MIRPIQAVILAAGRGTRMNSHRPKVLHEIFGRPLLSYPLEVLKSLGIPRPLVVVGWERERVLEYLKGQARIVIQSPQRGTGHAVQVAQERLHHFRGDILIWPADMPLVQKITLLRFIREHQRRNADATILSSLLVDPTGYGRIIRRAGRVVDIREEPDASLLEKRIQEVNTSIYLFKSKPLFESLKKIRPLNQKKEYYLTDTIRWIDKMGGRIQALPYASPEEAQGVNSQEDLASASKNVNQRNLRKHQMQGVTIVSPEQTWIAPEVQIGKDTIIHPWTYIEKGVRIGRGCEIGPFAKIRSGSIIEDGAIIGSFVEVVRSRIGKKVRAKHLAYLGDAVVGEGTNIGAGTITANYDGKKKNKTWIGKKAFIGVDTLFIAPVRVGDGAKTGAGAVLKRGTRVKDGQVFIGVPARPLRK